MKNTDSNKEKITMERIRKNRKKKDKIHCPESCNICGYNRKHIIMGGTSQCNCQAPLGTHTKIYLKNISKKLYSICR